MDAPAAADAAGSGGSRRLGYVSRLKIRGKVDFREKNEERRDGHLDNVKLASISSLLARRDLFLGGV